jgi:alpha-L-fucosidase
MTDSDPLVGRVTPSWYDEAKLGLFVTWSTAAIPAYAPLTTLDDLPGEDGVQAFRRLPYAEMYWNTMSIPGSPTARYHAEHYGDMPYEEFARQLRETMIPRFDPEPLAELFAQAGARYVVFFTKHEEGFLLWPSEHPNPRKGRVWQTDRDVTGELGDAVRAQGLRYGIAYSGGMDWTFADRPMHSWEAMHAITPQGPEYIAYADAHWYELIDRYSPAVLWNDYCYPRGADVASIFRHYLRRVPDGVINNRWDEEISRMVPGKVYSDFITPEYSTEAPSDLKWEACRGIGTSFGYNRQETEDSYLSGAELIHMLVDVVARGGNLLLNVGLMATGEVPWPQAKRLAELGLWLRQNGGAIYGTRPWERPTGISGEGIEVRYTQSAHAVHAIVLGSTSQAAVEIDVRLAEGAEVTLEGRPGALDWQETPAGVRILLPEPPAPQPAISLRLAPAQAVQNFEER